jgi:hypothetical protein
MCPPDVDYGGSLGQSSVVLLLAACPLGSLGRVTCMAHVQCVHEVNTSSSHKAEDVPPERAECRALLAAGLDICWHHKVHGKGCPHVKFPRCMSSFPFSFSSAFLGFVVRHVLVQRIDCWWRHQRMRSIYVNNIVIPLSFVQ